MDNHVLGKWSCGRKDKGSIPGKWILPHLQKSGPIGMHQQQAKGENPTERKSDQRSTERETEMPWLL